MSRARDSAGIRIVENAAPVGPALALDPVPAFDIGPAGGPGAEFVSSPVSAVRLPNGRIVAAGWAMTDVRIFDSVGRWLRTVGRRGAGPGEFEGLGFVYRAPGDTLVTFEPGTQRVQRWTPEVEFRSLAALISPGGRSAAWVWGVLDNGSLLLSTALPDEAANTPLTTRNRVTLFRALGPGGAWDSLFAFVGRVALRHPQNPTWTYGSPLFSPAPTFHQRGNQIAFTPGDRFEIHVWMLGGGRRMIVRRPAEPRPVSSAEFDRAVTAWVDGLPAELRERILPPLRQASTSRVRPPISAVWLAGDGRIWATFGEPAIGEPVRASVFDSLGRWEDDVVLPVGLQINQIDADGLLGTVKDDDGFRHLRFYRFRRAAS